ncbi:hypothetical protein G3N95_37030 [Paraburkholderia sp. Tr-20389]|uniref:hypothetical protein n=1 Tax=Paraburkholderia sp. Tr-20389 TaxID=2703903 RepID=UPI00197DF896|nr:hypothetical protein [Paraburkholderia sp. Tr-20389]MBN3758564.1 hypothetical protein [Paraburkholderia sp. Tr-20389]
MPIQLHVAQPATQSCEVIEAQNASEAQERERSLISKGYALIGTSSFATTGEGNFLAQAKIQGEKIGAAVVVVTKITDKVEPATVVIEYPQTAQEQQQCARLPALRAHTLLGTPIGPPGKQTPSDVTSALPDGPASARCDRMTTFQKVPVTTRRYTASYWAPVRHPGLGKCAEKDSQAVQ